MTEHVDAIAEINSLLSDAVGQYEIPVSQLDEKERIALILQATLMHGNIKK